MKFTHMGFIMTNRCNAACKICCFSCSPRGNLTLGREAIKDCIRQAADMGTFETIGFSGGEAILYFDQLKDCTACARDLGFRVTLVTNGFWARDYAKGLSMMTELAEAGLKSVSFSVDKFHQEFVPVETVADAMSIC
jgi:MoaA/NifB/PqqE/SkfB family radical SAM enzyme